MRTPASCNDGGAPHRAGGRDRPERLVSSFIRVQLRSSTFGTHQVPQPRQSQTARRNSPRGPSSRSKRAAILDVATDLFGREGYEHSKWADVAAAVGIGSTALYHYFESKLHCLYEIMAEALEADREKFERITAGHDDFVEALTP